MPFRCMAYTTPADNRNRPRHVIPSERSESRNLPKLQILPCVGTFLPRRRFLHSANATVGMTQWGDVSGFLSRTVPSIQVRAADCRPYNTFVLNFRVFNVSIIVLRP